MQYDQDMFALDKPHQKPHHKPQHKPQQKSPLSRRAPSAEAPAEAEERAVVSAAVAATKLPLCADLSISADVGEFAPFYIEDLHNNVCKSVTQSPGAGLPRAVYSVTVPTGRVVIRRNGKVFVACS